MTHMRLLSPSRCSEMDCNLCCLSNWPYYWMLTQNNGWTSVGIHSFIGIKVTRSLWFFTKYLMWPICWLHPNLLPVQSPVSVGQVPFDSVPFFWTTPRGLRFCLLGQNMDTNFPDVHIFHVLFRTPMAPWTLKNLPWLGFEDSMRYKQWAAKPWLGKDGEVGMLGMVGLVGTQEILASSGKVMELGSVYFNITKRIICNNSRDVESSSSSGEYPLIFFSPEKTHMLENQQQGFVLQAATQVHFCANFSTKALQTGNKLFLPRPNLWL